MLPLYASLIRKALDDALVIAAKRDECRADRIFLCAVAGRRPVDALDTHIGRKRHAAKVETQGAPRAELHRVRRLEQHAPKADVEQPDRNREREYGKFGICDDGAWNAAAIGRGKVTHAAARLQRSRQHLEATCLRGR